MWCMHQSIKTLMHMSYMIWKVRMFETQWLNHVDIYINKAMEEDIFNVHLLNGPI